MEEEILTILKSYSLEVLAISLIAFVLTTFIKLPIKKLTSKLDENKRKMVNIIIIFIPLLLSFGLSSIYSGLFKKLWFSMSVLDNSLSSWLLSLSMYAIFSRIWIIINGIKSGKIKPTDKLSKEMLCEIKNEIKEASLQISNDEKTLTSILESLSKLIETRNLLASEENLSLEKISSINSEIKSLQEQEKNLKAEIENKQNSLAEFNTRLKA